jgi:hypothetical protein
MSTDTLRSADLDALATLLRQQDARKLDLVVPATKMQMTDGVLYVQDAMQEISEDGVTSRTAALKPGNVFDEGLAEKLKVPVGYLKRLHAERPDLYDANVNGWLHGNDGMGFGPDPRSFLTRAFAAPNDATDGYDGFARAFLSDTFRMIDHFDVLAASLDGVRKAGVAVDITQCDLTERRMYVKVSAPQVTALAPELLRGYRSPFTGQTGEENPVVFAGFIISNSEVGNGAFSITPSMTVQVCKNGLTITKDAVRAVHLGARLDEGVVKWSEDTMLKTLELITLKASDAVATFLDVDYMTAQIRALEEQAGKPITGALPDVVKAVGRKMLFTEDQTDGILDHFLRGGQFTAGGVLQAVTSFAQTLDDADEAYGLEEQGIKAMEYAASL